MFAPAAGGTIIQMMLYNCFIDRDALDVVILIVIIQGKLFYSRISTIGDEL